jgi:hypothetical protein
MPRPYDATVKDLAAQEPAEFVACFDTPTDRSVTLLNVDLSTVMTAADVVFGIGEPLAEIVHLDAQAGASATKHLDVLLTGLRLKAPDQVRQLFHGVPIAMRESVTFQAILEEGREEGRVEELHRMILRLGRVRLGRRTRRLRARSRPSGTSKRWKN